MRWRTLLRALQIFQPQMRVGYSSDLGLLARQQDGDLRIRPEVIATTGEVRTLVAGFGPYRGWP